MNNSCTYITIGAAEVSTGSNDNFLRPDEAWDQTVWGRINQGRRELAAVLAKDVTMERLAELAGIRQSSVSGWKKGSRPKRENLEALELVFVSAGLVDFTARFLDYGRDEEQRAPIARDHKGPPPGGGGQAEPGAA